MQFAVFQLIEFYHQSNKRFIQVIRIVNLMANGEPLPLEEITACFSVGVRNSLQAYSNCIREMDLGELLIRKLFSAVSNPLYIPPTLNNCEQRQYNIRTRILGVHAAASKWLVDKCLDARTSYGVADKI